MTVNCKSSTGNYDIIIEENLLSRSGELIKKQTGGGKVFVVTDDNVHRLHGDALKAQLDSERIEYGYTVLPNGEHTKSHEFLLKLYSEFIKAGLTRRDCVVAFGGGVIGDLTGFAAATYLRGVKYIQIPTTLLSQVDSSVGGKVAVDLPEGKNLVGCFYPPSLVLIDTSLLSTLPERVFDDGMAEVIKYGAICDEELFSMLWENDAKSIIGDVITRCVEIKRAVVQSDEFDTGRRMILNFGHTYGHAVECYYHYDKYTHGEAVAVGMLKITQTTEKLGMTKSGTSERLSALLKKYNLYFPECDVDKNAAHDIIIKDKKSDGTTISYIIITEIGRCEIIKRDKDEVFI